jgi:hypothetical protein
MRRISFEIIVVVWMAVSAWPAIADQLVRVMTGADLRTEIVGNTLAGQYANGVVWREYFDPSGAIKGFDEALGHYVAHYSIAEDFLCFDYVSVDAGAWCGIVSANGSRITFYRHDEVVTDPPYTQLLRGNPYGL